MNDTRLWAVTIDHKGIKFRLLADGRWRILLFGTTGSQDNGIPKWNWVEIKEDVIPEEVIKLGKLTQEVKSE